RINIIDFERHKLNTVLESMGEGVVALNSRSKIIAVNSRALSLMDKKMTVELKALAEEVLKKGSRITRELQNNNHHLMVCATPLDSVKSIGMGVVIILNDITELRVLEEKQKIFMSNVSHELKTPLTTIQGYVELLKKNTSDEIFDMSVNYLESASERLTRLVNDLVELSTMKQPEFSLKPKKTDLAGLIRDIAGQMSLKAQKFGISIKCSLMDTAVIIADPVRIKQVLVNIIDNAIKYSQGDRIYINMRDTRHGKIELAITDNGIGISADNLKMVFEPFYRIDKARARNIGGNGLGLAISKEIVEKHGGKIEIASVEGKGTKFIITLPPWDKNPFEFYGEEIT
ncbi:MAG: cell wall metabolism sensor histidine kinase WalK, partial [Halanaerobiales bacterium]|nr:cell wall metabolism sensor histidine kinase WalK [Halanaerobiales bacterium]